MFAVKKTLLVAGFAVLLGSGAVQAQTGQPGMMGPGMMGQGQMRHGQMDQGQMPYGMTGQGQMPYGQGQMPYGMMGQGMSPGIMGGGMMMGQPSNLNLTVADVKANLERWLAGQGNPRLKIGDVAEKEGTITADIVTTDNSLVQRLSVDRNSGVVRSVQ
jgi:hypothetical protein